MPPFILSVDVVVSFSILRLIVVNLLLKDTDSVVLWHVSWIQKIRRKKILAMNQMRHLRDPRDRDLLLSTRFHCLHLVLSCSHVTHVCF